VLDAPFEDREVDDAGMHERVENGPSAHDHAVVRCIHGEVLGPEPLDRGQVPRQRRDPFLIVKLADESFVRAGILRHSDHFECRANTHEDC
jgi:hypothetical protein